MGLTMSVPQLLIILVVVALIFGTRLLRGIDDDDGWLRSHLRKKLGRTPVYSAETTNSKEAEFIRDHLPKRLPTIIVLGAVLIVGAVVWWLTR